MRKPEPTTDQITIARLRAALLATRNIIWDDPDNLNLEVIIDTVWFSPMETLVDYIDSVLEAE